MTEIPRRVWAKNRPCLEQSRIDHPAARAPMVCHSRPPLSFALIEPLEQRFVPATFLVTTSADSGPGSLRQAILDANHSASNLIRIEGVESIFLESALPKLDFELILEGNGTTLDGSAIEGSADGIVLGVRVAVYDLKVTHFPGHGFILDGAYTQAVGCSSIENGRGIDGGSAGFWLRHSSTGLDRVESTGNSGPGILFDAPSQLDFCFVSGATVADNAGPEVHIVQLNRSKIFDSTFVHGDGPAIAVESGSGGDIYLGNTNTFLGNTFIGNYAAPIDCGNNGPTANDAPSDEPDASGPDHVRDAPVLTEFKKLGQVAYVTGYFKRGSSGAIVSLYAEKIIKGTAVRIEIDRFSLYDSNEDGNATFTRILSPEVDLANLSLRATATDDQSFYAAATSELSEAVPLSSSVSDPAAIHIVTPKKAVLTGIDGGRMTLTTTKGQFNASQFDLVPTSRGYQLAALDLGPTFEGAKVRIVAKDSPAYVGDVHAEGTNLHTLAIKGELRNLEIGRDDGSVSLKKLDLRTLGNDFRRQPFFGDSSSIVAHGTVREATVRQSMQNAALLSLGGDIQHLEVRYVSNSLILAHDIGVIEAGLISSTTIRAETGGIRRIDAKSGISTDTYSDTRMDILARTTIGSINAGWISNARIVANADPTAGLGASVLAIGAVTVKGSAANSQILAGVPLEPLSGESAPGFGNGDVRIGSIRVRGDWSASDLAAGIDAGDDGIYGSNDDAVLPGALHANGNPAIERIEIGGRWMAEWNEFHAIVARTIGSVKVGKTTLPIPSGPYSLTLAVSEIQDGEMRLVQVG